MQFERDSIDETPVLAATLGDGAACTPFLDMQVRTLSGDHARPLQQVRGSGVFWAHSTWTLDGSILAWVLSNDSAF